MNYVRTASAFLESTALTLADDPLVELTCPASTVIEVIRVEIGAAEAAAPIDEIQPVALWKGTVAGPTVPGGVPCGGPFLMNLNRPLKKVIRAAAGSLGG